MLGVAYVFGLLGCRHSSDVPLLARNANPKAIQKLPFSKQATAYSETGH
jgi:hypothetical protein